MSTANQKILSRLAKPEQSPRKSLSIPFKTKHIEQLDAIAKALTQHSGRTTTRNMLIEDAVESLIDEAYTVFSEEGIPLEIPEPDDFDTLVLPAQDTEEYRTAFFDDREWRYVRVNKNRIPKIQYIAVYVGAPQSSIRHYAKVAPDGFIYEEREKKYKIRLDGDPIALENPVPLGATPPQAVRSVKYTTLQKLLSAHEFRDLYAKD